MAAKSWTLIDVASDTYVEGTETLNHNGFQVAKSTKRGGLSDGVDVLTVTNGALAFQILPTRGMSLWDAHLDGERFGWQSPNRGPVHPKFVDLGEPGGLGWLDGFDELLVRCGLENNGAPDFDEQGRLRHTLHGRIGNRPAHRLEVTIDDDQVTVVGEVEETRFHFLKLRMVSTIRTRRGASSIEIRDEIHNLSRSESEMQLLYHVNFGVPLLDAGARVVAPVKSLVPRNAHAASGVANWDSYEAESPGFEEQVYFLELLADAGGNTQTLLKNAHGTRGASLRFNKQQLPCFSLWKNTTAISDGYVTGIEPGTNFPNPRSFEGEQGRVVKLPAAGTTAFELGIDFHGSPEAVEGAEAAVAQLQATGSPKIYDAPQPGWCAD